MRATLLLLSFLLISTTGIAAQAAFDPISMEPQRNEAFPPAIEELTINSEGKRMPGLIYIANGPGPHPTVVLLHGFPGNEKNLDIAQVLRRAGFNVLFFHYLGAWGADGDYSLLQVEHDALTALNFLRNPENAAKYRIDTSKLSLLGHSLGGYVSLAAGHQDKSVVCVGAMSPANLGLWADNIQTKEPNTTRLLSYADTLFMLHGFNGAQMIKQMSSVPAATMDTRLFGPGLRGKSVFMVVGEQDDVTPAQIMFNPVVEAYAKDDKIKLQHHIISGDHSFSWSRLHLTRLVLDWMQQDCQ